MGLGEPTASRWVSCWAPLIPIHSTVPHSSPQIHLRSSFSPPTLYLSPGLYPIPLTLITLRTPRPGRRIIICGPPHIRKYMYQRRTILLVVGVGEGPADRYISRTKLLAVPGRCPPGPPAQRAEL